MSATTSDVDETDRLARVKLSCTIEPGDLRVTGLGSELGASKVLGYLEGVHYRPRQTGFRFSRKARGPSWASSLK
jgi:DNA processing protein